MRKQDRLRVLHVRAGGHWHAKIGFGVVEKSVREVEDMGLYLGRGINHEESKIRGDQFVAAAACVQLPAERAEFMHQRALNEVVDVFHRGAFEEGRIIAYLPGDVVEREQRVMEFRSAENSDALQSLGPGAIDGKLIGQQAAIKCKRALERVELFVRFALETPAPEAIVFALGFWSHRLPGISFQFAMLTISHYRFPL